MFRGGGACHRPADQHIQLLHIRIAHNKSARDSGGNGDLQCQCRKGSNRRLHSKCTSHSESSPISIRGGNLVIEPADHRVSRETDHAPTIFFHFSNQRGIDSTQLCVQRFRTQPCSQLLSQ